MPLAVDLNVSSVEIGRDIFFIYCELFVVCSWIGWLLSLAGTIDGPGQIGNLGIRWLSISIYCRMDETVR